MTTNIFKPILFNTEMVQAIVAGRKTQTRRTLKLKTPVDIEGVEVDCYLRLDLIPTNMQVFYANKSDKQINLYSDNEYAKYKPGDILWVRETWKVAAWNPEEYKMSFYYKASPGENFPMIEYNDSDRCEDLHLKTIEELDKLGEGEIDNEECTVTYKFTAGNNPLKWKPSLFMPKEAARIFLKVTNVRCERLQDILESDAIAEGVMNKFCHIESNQKGLLFPIVQFRTLWDSINAKKHPWESNPWVWVYDFERIEKPENF